MVTGGVDDEGVSGLSGVGERERREIGERDRDRDEPDADERDELDDDEGDRLIGALDFLCGMGNDDDTKAALAMSGRGAGRRVLSDSVLAASES